MPSETVTVFFDFLCPFAWRAAELAEQVAGRLEVDFVWSHFSLYQSDYQGRDGWQLWNQPLVEDDAGGCKGLLPFLADIAARKQGPEAGRTFRLALLRARHRDHRPLDLDTVASVTHEAGLHTACFERDLGDPEARTELAREHHRAAAENVFGTPTLRFATGDTAYLRLSRIPERPDEAVELYRRVRSMLVDYPFLETLKRPRHRGN